MAESLQGATCLGPHSRNFFGRFFWRFPFIQKTHIFETSLENIFGKCSYKDIRKRCAFSKLP